MRKKAGWSRRKTTTYKTGKRKTTTFTLGKGVTHSSSTKLGNKRTTFSVSPSGKSKVISTYRASDGATMRTVHSQGPLPQRKVSVAGSQEFWFWTAIIVFVFWLLFG